MQAEELETYKVSCSCLLVETEAASKAGHRREPLRGTHCPLPCAEASSGRDSSEKLTTECRITLCPWPRRVLDGAALTRAMVATRMRR